MFFKNDSSKNSFSLESKRKLPCSLLRGHSFSTIWKDQTLRIILGGGVIEEEVGLPLYETDETGHLLLRKALESSGRGVRCWDGKPQMQARKVTFKVSAGWRCNPVVDLGLADWNFPHLRCTSWRLGHSGALVSPCNIFLGEDT